MSYDIVAGCSWPWWRRAGQTLALGRVRPLQHWGSAVLWDRAGAYVDPVGTTRCVVRPWWGPCCCCTGWGHGNTTDSGCVSNASAREGPVQQGERVDGDRVLGMGGSSCLFWQPARSWAAGLGSCCANCLCVRGLESQVLGWVVWTPSSLVWRSLTAHKETRRSGKWRPVTVIISRDTMVGRGGPWAESGWRLREYLKEGCHGFGYCSLH